MTESNRIASHRFLSNRIQSKCYIDLVPFNTRIWDSIVSIRFMKPKCDCWLSMISFSECIQYWYGWGWWQSGWKRNLFVALLPYMILSLDIISVWFGCCLAKSSKNTLQCVQMIELSQTIIVLLSGNHFTHQNIFWVFMRLISECSLDLDFHVSDDAS